MYSLVSAPVLGFDLTRIAGGASAAEVLARSLTLDADDIAPLADQRLDDGQRAGLWAEVELATIAQPTVRDLAGAADGAESLALLRRAPLGTVDALLHCVRYDVLDWTWTEDGGVPLQSDAASAATAVVCDAIVATYLREQLDPAVRRRLAAGWVAAGRHLPERANALGPNDEAVSTLLGRVASLDRRDAERLFAAAEAARKDASSWAPAIHSASWAVHLADRVRGAAAAQFLLVQAVETSGIPVTERAAGVWNLLSGAVQALVARDLVDTSTAHRLLGPVLSTLGPTALG